MVLPLALRPQSKESPSGPTCTNYPPDLRAIIIPAARRRAHPQPNLPTVFANSSLQIQKRQQRCDSTFVDRYRDRLENRSERTYLSLRSSPSVKLSGRQRHPLHPKRETHSHSSTFAEGQIDQIHRLFFGSKQEWGLAYFQRSHRMAPIPCR